MNNHQNYMQELINSRRAELEVICTSIAELDVELMAIANRIANEENQFHEAKCRRTDLEKVRRGIDLFITKITQGPFE